MKPAIHQPSVWLSANCWQRFKAQRVALKMLAATTPSDSLACLSLFWSWFEVRCWCHWWSSLGRIERSVRGSDGKWDRIGNYCDVQGRGCIRYPLKELSWLAGLMANLGWTLGIGLQLWPLLFRRQQPGGVHSWTDHWTYLPFQFASKQNFHLVLFSIGCSSLRVYSPKCLHLPSLHHLATSFSQPLHV